MAKTTHMAGEALRSPQGRTLRAALFERVLQRIQRYFTRLVWDTQGADDCVQETLMLLERSLQEGKYDPQRSFNRWMWLKAHSVYVDYCRKRAKRPEALPAGADPVAQGGVSVDAKLDAATVLARLREVLDSEDFEIFVLFFGEGQTVTEVASVVGRDRKTVRKRLQAAKSKALQLL